MRKSSYTTAQRGVKAAARAVARGRACDRAGRGDRENHWGLRAVLPVPRDPHSRGVAGPDPARADGTALGPAVAAPAAWPGTGASAGGFAAAAEAAVSGNARAPPRAGAFALPAAIASAGS